MKNNNLSDLNRLSKYGFFNSEKLLEAYIELSKYFFLNNKGFFGGYLNRDVSNDLSLFHTNISQDAMIMLYDDSLFNCNEKTPNHFGFLRLNVKELSIFFEDYNIQKKSELRHGIFFINHKTGIESMITCNEHNEFEVIQNKWEIISYIPISRNRFESPRRLELLLN